MSETEGLPPLLTFLPTTVFLLPSPCAELQKTVGISAATGVSDSWWPLLRHLEFDILLRR